MKKILIAAIIISIVFSFASLSIAAEINVPVDYATIQGAIDAAMDGDTVLVADGIYTGEGNKNLDFDGKAITVTSKNGAEYTIIDCENNGRGFYFHKEEDKKSVVNGFTITNGYIIGVHDTTRDGGGILCWRSSPTITNNTISNNEAWGLGVVSYGGGICCHNSSPTIANNTISGNSATGGGGIYCRMSSPNITNNIISGNMDYAIRCSVSSATIANNTISRNGGGIYYYGSSLPSITDCILWNNSQNEIYDSGTPLVTYSCIQGGYIGIGNIDVDPLFLDANNGDFHLKQNSPCIDSGDPNSIMTEDMEGMLRPQDGNGDGTAIIDMGAYEFNPNKIDNDGDGFKAYEDCDDADPNSYPDASEICDGKDNNCNGEIDEGVTNTYYHNGDGDDYGDPNKSIQACILPEGYSIDNTDCNDNDSFIYPNALDICDNKDNDCDGDIDEDCCTFTAEITAIGQQISGAASISTIYLGIQDIAFTWPHPGPPPDYTATMELLGGMLEDYRQAGSQKEDWGLTLKIEDRADANQPGFFPLLIWDANQFCPPGSDSHMRLCAEDPNGILTTVIADMYQIPQYQTKPEDGQCFLNLNMCKFNYHIIWSKKMIVDMSLQRGWNMFSLPVLPVNPILSELFPDAFVVYKYRNDKGYVRIKPDEQLEVGNGYWIFLEEAHTYTLTGDSIEGYTMLVQNGWYMIGGCTKPARASVFNGNIYVIYRYVPGFGYQRLLESENLESGSGYWILFDGVSDQTKLQVNAIGSLQDGLVAYYPFNGNANDESGNGNDGTIHGAALTEDRFGNPNSAYSFDGNDIILADNPFPLSIVNTDPLTVSVWINTQTTKRSAGIVTQHTACYRNDDRFHITLYNDPGQYSQINGDAYNFNPRVGADRKLVTDGDWHHIAMVYTGDKGYLYIDGILQDSVVTIPRAQFDSSIQVAIGGFFSQYCMYDHHFEGSIDDVSIYIRALSDSEIQELYNDQST